MPKYVMVFGKKVRIEYRDDMAELHGDFDGSKFLIRINKFQSEKEQRLTIAHEALHAVLFISGISFILNDDLEEAVVRSMENGFLPIVEDAHLLTVE